MPNSRSLHKSYCYLSQQALSYREGYNNHDAAEQFRSAAGGTPDIVRAHLIRAVPWEAF